MKKDLSIVFLKDIYGALLTDNQRDMLSEYYDCDLSLGEIAENHGISRQAVRDSVKKGEDSLNEYEKKLGIKGKLDKIASMLFKCIGCDRLDDIKKKIEEIVCNIREME